MASFEFKKKFGQNFLSDTNLLTQIVEKSGAMSDDVVVEIGAGKGALTEILSKSAKKVYSFEIDSDLFEFLENKFNQTNVTMIFKDVMNVTDEKLNQMVGEKFKLVANLPYYVTSPIITRFLQNPNCESITVMVQEEVADRIIAKPKTKDYGVLTVICNLFGKSQKVLRVNRKMFFPVPNVDSAVIRIDIDSQNQNDYSGLISFVKTAFSMRRKKLSTNLEVLGKSKSDIENLFALLGLNPMVRAEELSVEDFKHLYNAFYDKNK